MLHSVLVKQFRTLVQQYLKNLFHIFISFEKDMMKMKGEILMLSYVLASKLGATVRIIFMPHFNAIHSFISPLYSYISERCNLLRKPAHIRNSQKKGYFLKCTWLNLLTLLNQETYLWSQFCQNYFILGLFLDIETLESRISVSKSIHGLANT